MQHRLQRSAWIAFCLAPVVGAAGCGQRATQPPPAAPTANPFAMAPESVSERPLDSDSHQRMLRELRTIRDDTADTIAWLGDLKARRLREQLQELPSTAAPAERFNVREELSKHELRLGNERQAIDRLLEASQILEASGDDVPAATRQQIANELYFALGVAHMRLAETQNCCQQNTPDSCILPMRGGGLHAKLEGSRQAISWFERVLENEPANSVLWLRSLWLYNIAHMTLNQYPEGVVAEWRLPQSAFQPAIDFPEFQNVAKRLGLDTFNLAGGAIADDFDGDGCLDLVVSTSDTAGQLRFFLNDTNGGYRDVTESAGLTGLYGGLNAIQADFDNDGFIDILVLRGGWFQSGGRHPNSLLHNNGDGTFTDVTFDAGLTTRAPTQTAAWSDYDNDGDLDLYIGNETNVNVPIPSQLYQSNGDGTFTDVADDAGVLNDRFSKAVVWGDFDQDRYADIYVSNFGQPNRLYRNQGNGTFVDVATRLGVSRPLRSFPAWFWDYNNDGAIDLYVSSYADDTAHLSAHYLGLNHGAEPACLYRGRANGTFAEVGQRAGLTMPTAPMGSNFGDLDNDGYLDFYLGTGEPEYRNLLPNVMYHNQRGETFNDVTMSARFGHVQKGHAVVFADLDRDGDQDVFEQIGGAYPGDRYYDALFENPGFGNHWIAVRVIGTSSNRSAIGVRIHLRVREGDTERSIFRHVTTGGSFGANPLVQHIGTGGATRIEALEVFWPSSGKTRTYRDLATDQTVTVVEGLDHYTAAPRVAKNQNEHPNEMRPR